jgi:hypothetical protein
VDGTAETLWTVPGTWLGAPRISLMKKLLILAVLVALGVLAARRLQNG